MHGISKCKKKRYSVFQTIIEEKSYTFENPKTTFIINRKLICYSKKCCVRKQMHQLQWDIYWLQSSNKHDNDKINNKKKYQKWKISCIKAPSGMQRKILKNNSDLLELWQTLHWFKPTLNGALLRSLPRTRMHTHIQAYTHRDELKVHLCVRSSKVSERERGKRKTDKINGTLNLRGGCIIHCLCICRGEDFPNECPGYDTK